jgi:hypothetical protein
MPPKYLLDSLTDISLYGRGVWLAEVTNWGSNKFTAMETVTNMTIHNSINTTNPVATTKITNGRNDAWNNNNTAVNFLVLPQGGGAA